MIKKLQLRFVLVSMGALLLVLVTILTAMNVVNYHGVVEQADSILNLLSENGGRFPDFGGDKGPKPLPAEMSPELPYESRYFTVLLQEDSGVVSQIDTGRIAAVDSQQAAQYAQAVLEEGKDRGFLDRFRYVRLSEDGEVRIIFLDCGRQLDSFQNFLWASIGICALGYLVVLLLVAFFSYRIVRPLSQSYEKQKQFITDAGHELKTPLTIIRADTDVLHMELGENEWLEDIRKQTDRLASLTADLVMLARMEESASREQMIEFPVSDVISETAASFLAPAQTQGKALICQVQPMLALKGSEKGIIQLVNILLDNALKYSPKEGEISLALEKQGKALRLTVSNSTAEPLRKDQLAQMFQRFYRGDPSRSSEGYGIGLSVAQAIVAAHSGRIRAEAPESHRLVIIAVFPQS